MVSKRLDSIADYARHGLRLRVECRCGRVVLLDASKLMLDCHRRGRSKVVVQLAGRLRRGDCGERPKHWGPM